MCVHACMRACMEVCMCVSGGHFNSNVPLVFCFERLFCSYFSLKKDYEEFI